MDITERLEERAVSYEASGPSAHHTAALLREAAAEVDRLRLLLVRWLNGGDAMLAQDSRDAINPPVAKTKLKAHQL